MVVVVAAVAVLVVRMGRGACAARQGVRGRDCSSCDLISWVWLAYGVHD